MSCVLKDYYKEGVPLEESMKIILGLIECNADVVEKVMKDYSKLNLISRNLESLGFLENVHPPAAADVTVRGGTLVLSKRSYIVSEIDQLSVSHEMARFVLLKAIRDADWECFKEFSVALLANPPSELKTHKAKSDYVREKFYPQFSPGNMRHWYPLHMSFLAETGIGKLSENMGFPTQLNSLDPYADNFAIEKFFSRSLKRPSEIELRRSVEKALEIYEKNLLVSAVVGHSETLKTITEILLLDAGLFDTELRLSEGAIAILKKKGVGLMRSNYPMLTEGRGFVDSKGREQTSFKLFTIA